MYVSFQIPSSPCAYLVYVFYVWETNDLFLGTPDHCLLHHYIYRWFDYSLWIDLRWSVLICLLLIYLFFSWYLICLTYIVICSYIITFYVRYFPHITIIHLISNSIYIFFHYWYIHFGFFLPHRYIHIKHPQSMNSKIFWTYYILYMRIWDFIIGIIEPSFLSFFTLLPYPMLHPRSEDHHEAMMSHIMFWLLSHGRYLRSISEHFDYDCSGVVVWHYGPHIFNDAYPLDWRDSLFFYLVKNMIFRKDLESPLTFIYF